MKKVTRRGGYREAVQWIADNDGIEDCNEEEVSGFLTVALVADLFGVDQSTVARDIMMKAAMYTVLE